MKNYSHVILGGTFDHFHLGHQRLLEKAVSLGKKITIGLAKKNLYKNKILAETIEDYQTRKKSLQNFLKNYLKDNYRINIIPLSDIFGTTLTDPTIDAIVVSKMTYKNAILINKKRKEKGMREMKIFVVDDVLADDGKLLTSEKIRMGEVDRSGKSYWLLINSYWSKGRKELILPEEMREELRRPLGKVFSRLLQFNIKLKQKFLIAVGDIVVGELLKAGVEPQIKVIDFRSRRKPIDIILGILNSRTQINYKSQVLNSKQFKNRPATINIKTALRLKKIIGNALFNPSAYKESAGWLVVEGEEDLLTLPAILFAPLGALVLYGQMDRGVVVVEITEAIKNKAKTLISRFI